MMKNYGILNNDLIDVIATDHATQLRKTKSILLPSGGPLVQHRLFQCLTYHNEKISLEKIVQKMCTILQFYLMWKKEDLSEKVFMQI